MKFLNLFFKKKKILPEKRDALSDFISDISSKEKKAILKEVVEKANKDQQAVMEQARMNES